MGKKKKNNDNSRWNTVTVEIILRWEEGRNGINSMIEYKQHNYEEKDGIRVCGCVHVRQGDFSHRVKEGFSVEGMGYRDYQCEQETSLI